MICSDVRFRVPVGVLLHLGHDELLVEGAAIDADADRPAVFHGDLANGCELFVAPSSRAHVAGVDAVLVECLRAGREPREQQMAVVMKVANQRRRAAGVHHALLDFGDGGGRFGDVDGDAHHLGAGLPQLDALLRRSRRIRGIGHRHRLDDDWGAPADGEMARREPGTVR